MTHLGARISALVDGELDHESRDRALAHVAHCSECRNLLDAERSVKDLLGAADGPAPPDQVLAALHGLALPGGPLPPRARTMPQGPVVPVLPPPGRRTRRVERASRGPSTYASTRHGTRRVRLAAAGTLSVAGLLLVTAFAAGGQSRPSAPVVPPSAELSVEHTATTAGITVGDPGLGAAGGLADVSPADTPGR